jgi:hypothetical protein
MFFFILLNKPGMVIFGSEEDFNDEQDNGYAPYKISVKAAHAMLSSNNDLWVYDGNKCLRFKSTWLQTGRPRHKGEFK